jgi:hypothetical protein
MYSTVFKESFLLLHSILSACDRKAEENSVLSRLITSCGIRTAESLRQHISYCSTIQRDSCLHRHHFLHQSSRTIRLTWKTRYSLVPGMGGERGFHSREYHGVISFSCRRDIWKRDRHPEYIQECLEVSSAHSVLIQFFRKSKHFENFRN